MVDPVTFTAYATPAALVLVAVINGFSARRIGEVKAVVTKVEEQTNSRLTTLLNKVAALEATLSRNASTTITAKLDQISQDVKDAKK